MTLRELFDDHLQLLGQDNPDLSPQTARDRALADIRAALQLMQTAGEDFYSRETIEVTLEENTGAYTLAKDIQTVLQPLRLTNGAPLRKLQSRSMLAQFGQLFLGRLDNAQEAGTPLAYFVESLRDDDEDNVRVVLHVTPIPNGSQGTLYVDVIKEPPTYTADDLCNDTVPPVPHKYHESILRPLVRWNATTSRLFRQNNLVARLEADYNRALNLLGLADPRKSDRRPATQAASSTQTQPEEAAA